MRRITVELTAADITRAFGKSHRFDDHIRSLEVLTFLKSTPNEIVEICKVQLNDPAASITDVFTHPSEEVSVLQQEAADTYVCFYRKRPIRRLLSIVSSVPGGYLSTPYEVRDGRLRITLLGNTRSLRIFLKTLQKDESAEYFGTITRTPIGNLGSREIVSLASHLEGFVQSPSHLARDGHSSS